MRTVTSAQEFLDRKKGFPCLACHFVHPPKTPCSREEMAFRIKKLVEANEKIPELLKMNTEATELAMNFRLMLKKADEAHTILMELLKEHGEVGEEISIEYMKRVNAWAQGKERTSQDTSDLQPSLFSPELSTPNETPTNVSTKQGIGLVSERDSSLPT